MILSYSDFYNPVRDSYRARLGDAAASILAQEYMENTFAKGLATTGTIAQSGTTGGDALKMEDLTKQIAVAELQVKSHAVFLNWVKRVPAFSDVLEKTVLDSWGGIRRGGFVNASLASAGLAPADPALTRGTLQVKWMGGRYQVFRTALAVRGLSIAADPVVGSAEEVSSTSRLQQLMLNVNELCYHGDPTKNVWEPEGILKQARDAHSSKWECRYDCKGQPITPAIVPDIEEILRSKGGIWTDLFWSPGAFADMRKAMNNYIRTQTGVGLTVGTYPKDALIMDLAGNSDVAKLHIDNFLDPIDEPQGAEGPIPPSAPASVTVTPIAATPNAWGSFLAGGTYNYSVDAVGINGRSAVTVAGSVAAPSGSQKVNVVITAGAGLVGDVAFFEVYRGNGASGKRKYLGRVGANGLAAGGTVTFVDDGEFVPGCSTAIALTNRQVGIAGSEVMLRQLFPQQKVKLPNNVMSEEAAWLLACTPQMLTPQFSLVLENIGRL